MNDQERIAVLEANQARLQKDVHELITFIKEHMKEEEKRWAEISDTLTKWKGFVGGVVFITSALWAAFYAFVHFLSGKLS